MGRKGRLMEYWRKLRGIYHRADTASGSDVHPDPATSRIYEAAIRKYGIPERIYADEGILVKGTRQKVTRSLRYEMSRGDVETAMKAVRKIERQSKSPISMPRSSSTS